MVASSSIASSLDRLGVCNRLNLLLLDEQLWDAWLPDITEQLAGLGIKASLPPHDHPLGYEWALDSEREATVTIAPAASPAAAAAIANDETSGLAAGIAAADAGRRAGVPRGLRAAPAPSGTRRPGCSTGSSCLRCQRPGSTWTRCPARVAR